MADTNKIKYLLPLVVLPPTTLAERTVSKNAMKDFQPLWFVRDFDRDRQNNLSQPETVHYEMHFSSCAPIGSDK
jgi:hypothetical protein